MQINKQMVDQVYFQQSLILHKMNSNNLNEGALLSSFVSLMQHWGINYVGESQLKQAKKNHPSVVPCFKRLLFDLAILHILDYKWTVDEMDIEIQQEEMDQVSIAYLVEMEWPGILQGEQGMVGARLCQSRELLLICGWILAVTDFFSKTKEKLLIKKLEQIYLPTSSFPQNKNAVFTHSSPQYDTFPPLQRIFYLLKSLKSRRYNLSCLVQKKQKLLKRIRKQAHENGMTVEDILGGGPADVSQKQLQLKNMIELEMESAKHWSYFWVWLDQKLIPAEYKSLEEKHDHFTKSIENLRIPKHSANIDLNYLPRFISAINSYPDRLDALKEKVKLLNLQLRKEYKEIKRQIDEDIKKMKERGNQKDGCCFVAIQINQYMSAEEQKNDRQQENTNKKQSKNTVNKKKSILRKQIEQFLQRIDTITLI